jgi:hypothetical protein
MSAQINQQISAVRAYLEALRTAERTIQEQIAEKNEEMAALQEQAANLQERAVAPKKWHCGTGGDTTGGLNYGTALENSSCYICSCTPDFIGDDGKPAPRRCKQFETFRREANPGDIIFLHHKKVTHWGKYTGEILSYREGYPNPAEGTNPAGLVASGYTGLDHTRHQFHIKVERWVPISGGQFMGTGEQKTLYEVTDHANYN